MKRILALILAAIMVVCCFASCTTLEKGDKGAIITVYLADELYDYDPTQSYTNDTIAQLTTLMFEGLTVMDNDGNWKKGMMDSYEVLESEDGNTKLQITLRETKWSDGRRVQANDFVYAWKRLLEPTFKSDAACLLYDIKNAKDIKMGDNTVDDLGVNAVETYLLEIEFNKKVDVDAFFRTCASPALVPLREDKVGAINDWTKEDAEEGDALIEIWARKSSSMITNGPFDIRKMVKGSELRLERSSYYYRDTESNQPLDKYVIPYRLYVKFGVGNEEAQVKAFENGENFYLGDIALAARADYADKAEVVENLNTYTYVFNTEVELFSDAKVRRALSLALDREAIAKAVVFADAATGLVPTGIADAKVKNDFREVGGELVKTSANVQEAKKLLSEAGVSGGDFTLTVRNDEVDIAIAKEAKKAWDALGFDVKIDSSLGIKTQKATIENESNTYVEEFQIAYEEGDFEVIGIDYQMLANDAWAALAPFAPQYSGNGVDMKSGDYDVYKHICGYDSADYNKIIDEAYAEGDYAKRVELMHKAEEQLMKDMPVVPVIFLKTGHVVNEDVLSGFKTSFWGAGYFNKVKMKDYMTYKEAIEASENA